MSIHSIDSKFSYYAKASILVASVIVGAALLPRIWRLVQPIFFGSASSNTQGSDIEAKKWTNTDRKEIYEQNKAFIENGFYLSPQNTRFDLKKGAEFTAVSTLTSNLASIDPIPPKYEKKDPVVVNQDCLEAAQELVKKGHKVAVVNFASHITPGGRFDRGTNGQEENLCHRSELAGFMDAVSTDFYPLGADEKRPERLIHTPEVLVFRASSAKSYTLLNEPFRVGILTSAAPYQPELSSLKDYAHEDDRLHVRALIITQLFAAYEHEYDSVILGAFGSGYYKNPPQAVARIYKEVIDASFQGVFKQIVFAILDDPASQGDHNPQGNFKPFAECFKAGL
jgi:uncharacterized protein (TIGR02452 family)